MRKLLILLTLLLARTLPAQHYLLPGAGNHAGGNGTFFKSDVSIFNPREDNQRVLARWLPAGRPADGAAPAMLVIPAFDTYIVEDFVEVVLNRHELGAVLFTAIRENGEPDPNARLV